MVLCVLLVLITISVAGMVILLRNAPEGFEGENGFHLKKKDP